MKTKKPNAIIPIMAIVMLIAITMPQPSQLESQVVHAQQFNPTIVSTELINFYGMTSSEVQNFIEIAYNQGITIFTIRLNAMSEFQSGTSTGISKSKQIITEANQQGIQVCVDLHTWYTTWDNYFRDSASNSASYRSQYITYVRNVIGAFDDSNVYAFMVLNEPQARTASNSENQFILDIINAAKEITNKPVSVRFMAGYSPSTGHYSPQIDRECTFISRNTYWDPRNPSITVYGTTQAKLLTAITIAHSHNQDIWFTEFGKTKSDLEEQRSYVAAFVSWAKANGVDACFCWVCQPEGGAGESYNLFDGYVPYPAFYELVNDGVVPPPTPTPQATNTPSPTLTPKPSSTPQSTPTPTPTLSPTPTPSPTTRNSHVIRSSGSIIHEPGGP
jgi:hypothetical protein